MPVRTRIQPTLYTRETKAPPEPQNGDFDQLLAVRGQTNRNLLERVRGTQRSAYNTLRRDLAINYHNRQVEISFALWRFNPFAKRIINTYVDFIVSDGIRPVSKDEATQKALDAFWDHPYNKWDKMIHRRVRDLLIYGELLHSVTVTTEGYVMIHAFQPTMITDIRVLATNHEIATSIKYHDQVASTEEKEAELIIPQFTDKGKGAFAGYNKQGKFFLFGINQTTDSPRGVGELFPLIDHIDVYDDMLFNRSIKIANSANMWWDLQAEGLTDDQIKKKLEELANVPPEPGSVFSHNERMTLELKSATSHADDYSKDVETERSHILGSAAIPGTWLDAPGGAGRAVGAEMAEGTYKAIVSLQKQLGSFLRTEIDFHLWQLQRKNPSFKPEEYVVRFSSPSTRDLQRNGSALHRISQALHMLWEIGAIDTKQAAQFAVAHMNEVGVSGHPLVPSPQENPPALQVGMRQPDGGSGREPSTNDDE